jgi:hypothetical protein
VSRESVRNMTRGRPYRACTAHTLATGRTFVSRGGHAKSWTPACGSRSGHTWAREPHTSQLFPDRFRRSPELFEQVRVDPVRTIVLTFALEIMLGSGVPILMQRGIPATAIYASIYNQTRPHRTLDGKTPYQVYYDNLTTRLTSASSDHREAPLKG